MKFLGYDFRDLELLDEALTTPAYKIDHPKASDNQRLEFLGDAVLGFLSAEELFAKFPGEKEGKLTVRRTHMVSSVALCEAAARLDLKSSLKRNRAAEELPDNSKTLADAIEAIIGAAYLDGGMDAAREVYATLALESVRREDDEIINPKGALQVKCQAMKPQRLPVYELIACEGKAHAPEFTVKVTVEGVGEAVAKAGNRKEAETLAARTLVNMI
ncbi:MAG: ribonuclease III [Kiritimatiellae bacterium]|nr:ribonuclease III [Kiritimatiellia bacterium]